MKVTKEALDGAIREEILSAEQADKLHAYLRSLPSSEPTFNFTNILYYLGGLLAIGAMSLFMAMGWESFGGWGIFFISLAYAGIGLKLANVFQKKGNAIPAGICATFAVSLTPLAIYGLQQALDVWPDRNAYRDHLRYIRWHHVHMEIGTLITGTLAAWRYRYPFLTLPIAVTLWYMSMDIAVMMTNDYRDFEFRALFSMYFGLAMILIALWVDFKTQKTADYAFWLYLFAVIAFWGGMTSLESDSEISKLIYFCINLAMIGAGVLLVRRVFVIFGAIGSCLYLSHLASTVFEDSWLFPFALTAIGLLIIYLGILWQKHEDTLTQKSRALLPPKLRDFLDSKAP